MHASQERPEMSEAICKTRQNFFASSPTPPASPDSDDPSAGEYGRGTCWGLRDSQRQLFPAIYGLMQRHGLLAGNT